MNTDIANLQLGSELAINRLGLGAMRLAANGFTGPARDPRTSIAVLQRALTLGVNFIDTADFYRSNDGKLRANVLIREALHPYDQDLVIATKVGPMFDAQGRLQHAKPADMRRLVEDNLRSLALERLDLVYLRIGTMTPPYGECIAERFEALAALQAEGLIRHLGLSNVNSWHLADAQSIAPVVAVQNDFNIARQDDRAMLDVCTAAGIAFSPFFPLGVGVLRLDDARLQRVAARHQATAAQIALAWLLARSPVTLAIPGTGSLNHLEENMVAAAIQLSGADLEALG